jgi:hypothetical protein
LARPLQNFAIYFYTVLLALFVPYTHDMLSCNFNNISHYLSNADMASKFVHTLPYLDKHTEQFIEPTITTEELGTACVNDRSI